MTGGQFNLLFQFMRILYIGSGFVGACSAAVAADSGHDVLVYDIDEAKIKMLGSGDRDTIENCLFEKGLGDMLVRNKEQIEFTTDYAKVEKFLDEEAEVVFMCLPTPEKKGADGETDLTYYFAAAEKTAVSLSKRNKGAQDNYIVIVNKSTVPIEMVDETQKIMDAAGVKNYGIVSNPEFLVEGKAIEGSVKPDRVVVGAWEERDFKIMREVYQRFYNSPNVQYIEANPKEAAAGKLLANFLLLTKLVTTYDVVGRVAEYFPDINFEKLRHILSTDDRIGKWGFFDSICAGGSCLIKDSKSLEFQLKTAGSATEQIKGILNGNSFQLHNFYERAKKEAGFDYFNKKIAILGVAFKRDTNDVRNSGAIDIVRRLVDDGAKEIRIYDPAAMPMFEKMFDANNNAGYKAIKYFDNEKDALLETGACMILTDWPKFRAVGDVIREVCKPPYLIMDGRRMLADQFEDLSEKGYDIISVGSAFIKGKV